MVYHPRFCSKLISPRLLNRLTALVVSWLMIIIIGLLLHGVVGLDGSGVVERMSARIVVVNISRVRISIVFGRVFVVLLHRLLLVLGYLNLLRRLLHIESILSVVLLESVLVLLHVWLSEEVVLFYVQVVGGRHRVRLISLQHLGTFCAQGRFLPAKILIGVRQ